MFASRLAAAAVVSISFLSPAAAQPASRTILLWSYGYTPAPIRLAAGRPITLTFVNRAGKTHDFTAPRFFANSRVVAGSAPDGGVELRAGQSRSITLVPRAGVYRVHCGQFLHKQFGMRSQIIVN